MVLTRIQRNKPPPLDPKVEGVFVGGEEVVEEEVHLLQLLLARGTDPLIMKSLNILNSYKLYFMT